MGPEQPATIEEIVDVDPLRPRDLDSPGYLQTRDRIFRVMGMSLRVGETAAAFVDALFSGRRSTATRRN
jgi:hypothetical protein